MNPNKNIVNNMFFLTLKIFQNLESKITLYETVKFISIYKLVKGLFRRNLCSDNEGQYSCR